MCKFDEKYQERAEENKLLGKYCPEIMKHFGGLHKKAISNGSLDKKQKELIGLGIAIADRCEGCILVHVQAAIALGVTIEEIAETVEVAILMGGGPSATYGGHALNIAESLIEK